MKTNLLLILLCLSSLQAVAQLDSENKSFVIPAEETDDIKEDPEVIATETPIAVADNKPQTVKPNLPEQPKREFSMIEDNNFRNPAELYKEQLKRNLQTSEKTEERNNGSSTNLHFGEVTTKVSSVNIVYRDHEYPDGDRIRVFVNDDIIVPNVLLQQSYNGLRLKLQPGFNKIDFQALNQGLAGPNTAEFKVLDEEGNVISTNVWNLATGVKATIIINKE
ncbi:hypothetical protein [Lacinutrix salivirga]